MGQTKAVFIIEKAGGGRQLWLYEKRREMAQLAELGFNLMFFHEIHPFPGSPHSASAVEVRVLRRLLAGPGASGSTFSSARDPFTSSPTRSAVAVDFVALGSEGSFADCSESAVRAGGAAISEFPIWVCSVCCPSPSISLRDRFRGLGWYSSSSSSSISWHMLKLFRMKLEAKA